MRKFSDIKWPTEYSELKRIEELLVCGICYDYMETSVMTPCSHNYCSLCIRKYLHYKNQCPACFQDTFEKDLHTNRVIDEIILYFSEIRDKLVNCVPGAMESELNQELTTPPTRPARTNHQKNPEFIQKPDTPPDKPMLSSKTPPKSLLNQFSSPSTSGTSKLTSFFTPKTRKTDINQKQVPCPVCRVKIAEPHINRHLDACLKRNSQPERPPRSESKRKPLPKLVFCLMKDTELRKKMKALHLSIKGDRKTLESRYHRYCTLYNAECDKLNPRTVKDLLKQCEEEEELEKSVIGAKSSTLNISRNTNENVIEAVQRQYLELNKDKFDSLIEQIRNRKAKPTVRRSLNLENESPSSEDVFSPEKDDDSCCSSRPVFEAAFQDNDSDDDTCLLQTYISEHPMSFLSLQSSDDSPPKSETKYTPKSRTCEVISSHRNDLEDNLISSGTLIEEPASPVNVFDLPTDPDSSDDSDRPNELKKDSRNDKNILKRLKLQADRIDGMSLAQSIAQDFCDGAHDSEDQSTRIDKENEKTMKHQLRKRNHPSRFSALDKTLPPQPSRFAPVEALREEINGNKAVSVAKDTMQKRRRRKWEPDGGDEQILPPRRPIRRRKAGSVLQNSAN